MTFEGFPNNDIHDKQKLPRDSYRLRAPEMGSCCSGDRGWRFAESVEFTDGGKKVRKGSALIFLMRSATQSPQAFLPGRCAGIHRPNTLII